MYRIYLNNLKASLLKSWKGILQVVFTFILSILFCYYFSILNIKGWDFPVYLNTVYNSMQSPFSQSYPIRNSILYTFIFILDNFFVKDPILSLKIIIFLISILTIVSLIIFSKQISNHENKFKFKNIFTLLIIFYLFSPLFLELSVLYKQYILMLFFLSSLICVFQIFSKFDINSLKTNFLKFICLSLLLTLSNLSSVLSLITTLSLLFLPIAFLLKKSEEISKRKVLNFVFIYAGIFYFSIILSDLFAFFTFQNELSHLSMLSPYSYSFYVGIARILESIGIVINQLNPLLVVSIFSFIIIFLFITLFYLLLYLRINHKIDFSKKLIYFTISMFLLHLLLSLIFINERGDAYPGYQFSFYYLWGGFFTVHLLLYKSENKNQQNSSLIENGFLIIISFLFVILNMMKILQVIGGGSFLLKPGISMTEEYIAFPLGRIYLFLLIPFSVLAMYKIKKIESFKEYFVNIVVTYILISIILLIQIPYSYITNFQIYEIYREVNQINRLTRVSILIVLLIIPNKSIFGNILKKLSNKMNLFKNIGNRMVTFFKKISNKMNYSEKKFVYKGLVSFIIIIQVVSTIGIAIGLPPVIQDHELQFIEQIDTILEDNTTIAVAYHQTQWFKLFVKTNCSVLSLNLYPKEISESSQATNLTLDFIYNPSNDTLTDILDIVETTLYIWISNNPRYMFYAPYDLAKLLEFKEPILIDVSENNYLFCYELGFFDPI